MTKAGVLLVNLGTPDSPKPRDVFRYLNEFLTDGRVIDIPWLWRQLLVRLFIVPQRYRASAALYRRIWTPEGSPLLLHSQAVRDQLQQELGDQYIVTLGMRYQQPSIAHALKQLEQAHIQHLIVLPLFPQYASATTGSVHQQVMQLISRWQVIPDVRFVNSYPTQPQLIEAFYQRGQECEPHSFDHIIFSFHGLPERHLRKADRANCCLRNADCCNSLKRTNHSCYRAQCVATASALAERLSLRPESYSISFQSRLGKDPWTRPYTDETLLQLAQQGKKRLLVFAPAFTCDCLETIDEIGREYAHQFTQAGGEELRLVPGLNSHPIWIQGLAALVQNRSALCRS